MFGTVLRTAAVLCCILGYARSANATVIGFEDLTPDQGGPGLSYTLVPSTYQGLTWSGQQGAKSWAVSPAGVLWFPGPRRIRAQTLPGARVAATSQYLQPGRSALLAFGPKRDAFVFLEPGCSRFQWDHGGLLQITDTYQLFVLNFIGITSWTLTNRSANIVIDDIYVTTTPLPAALPLFGTGLGPMGFVGWWRKRRAEAVA